MAVKQAASKGGWVCKARANRFH